MYHRFLTFIKNEKLTESKGGLLLGVSGGVDSMVMAHLVLQAGLKFGVAHVNYKLRGAESDQDADLVSTWCESEHIPFYLKEVDPDVYNSDRSIQMVARDIRYGFYAELAEREGYTEILTAHNANDNLETALFNLSKGTGIAGLVGIAARKGNLVRPLLFATKEEIYAYARSKNIRWREDKSNAKNDYARNLIRNEIIPRLKEINPSLESTFQDSQIRFSGAAQLLREEKHQVIQQYVAKHSDFLEVKTRWLNNDNKSLLVLSEIIKDYGFNFQEAKDLFQAVLDCRSGAFFYAANFEINLDRDRFLILHRRKDQQVNIEITRQMESVETPDYRLHFRELSKTDELGAPDTACFDLDCIGYPMKLRNWQEGDWFVPLGMKGKKKVSDFMIDSKIAVSLKRKVLVLESQGEILWVIGHRINDRFKVTSDTTTILKIEIEYA